MGMKIRKILIGSLILFGGLISSSLHAGEAFKDCEDCPTMVPIEPGSFMMGSHEGYDDEKPVHQVNIAYKFAVGKYEVTRAQYRAFIEKSGYRSSQSCKTYTSSFKSDYSWEYWKMQPSMSWENPGFQQGDRHPVTCVSWDDAKAYVTWLSRETGLKYRLLSEAEWEYVARAGSKEAYSFGTKDFKLCQHGNGATGNAFKWGNYDCGERNIFTAEVGTLKVNPFGIHDLYGNVMEWVDDCFYEDNYLHAPRDGSPQKQLHCGWRHLRGGSWIGWAKFMTSTARFRYKKDEAAWDRGIRVARDF